MDMGVAVMAQTIPVPKESQEQMWLFRWAELQKGKYPELEMLYHIPNGGSRNKLEAAHLQAEGVKPGVPDLCLPVSRGGYHGLYIELKRLRGGKVSDAQTVWLARLRDQNFKAVVCKGWEEAAECLKDYLDGRFQCGEAGNGAKL